MRTPESFDERISNGTLARSLCCTKFRNNRNNRGTTQRNCKFQNEFLWRYFTSFMYIMNHLLLQRDSANVTIIKTKDTIKRKDEIQREFRPFLRVNEGYDILKII